MYSTDAYLEQAKLHKTNNAHRVLHMVQLQAYILYYQGRIDEAKSEHSHAAEGFEKIGAAMNAERCRKCYNSLEMY